MTLTSWTHTLLLATLPLLILQDKRFPIPDAAAQKEAEKLVRDVFKEDYAQKSAAARTALARKLLQQGLETKGDPTSCFVLFREARDLAVAAGDAAVALQAIAEIASRYEVDPVDMKGAALASMAKTARTAEEFTALAKAYLDLAGEAANADDPDSAEAAASAGGTEGKGPAPDLEARFKKQGVRRPQGAGRPGPEGEGGSCEESGRCGGPFGARSVLVHGQVGLGRGPAPPCQGG